MLDASATTRDPASRARRVARAWEAHDEVARHLAGDADPGGRAAVRKELTAGLAALRSRLVDVG